MKKRFKINKLNVCKMFFVLCLIPATLHAIMSAEYYEKKAQRSKIKAIAIVENIGIIEKTEAVTHKTVYFKRLSTFTEDTREIFTGTCYSTDDPRQKPGEGGTIYFYPEIGSKVFVTISSDGGSITSYTVLSPELEETILANPDIISFKMGKIFLNGR